MKNFSANNVLGQLFATQAAIRVIVARHPECDALTAEIDREIENGISAFLASSAPDDIVAGLQEAKLILLPPAKPG
jgi:fructose-1,6-bisphosphatase/inositol monophosphatase family enzyme